MKHYLIFMASLLLSAGAHADDKVIEKNVGGTVPVELSKTLYYGLPSGVSITPKSLATLSQNFKDNNVSLYQGISLTASDDAIEDLLKTAGLPAVKSSKEVQETIVVQKDRCAVKETKKSISFNIVAEDEFFLNSLGGKCKRAFKNPEKLQKLRAKGECLVRSFSNIANVARLQNVIPFSEITLRDEVKENVPSHSCQSNPGTDPGFSSATECSQNVLSLACARVTAGAPQFENGKWVYKVSMLQNSVSQTYLGDLTRQQTRTVTTEAQFIGFQFDNVLLKNDGFGFDRNAQTKQWEAQTYISSVFSNYKDYADLKLVVTYTTDGKGDVKKADYPGSFKYQSLTLDNLAMPLSLKRSNIIKIQSFVENVFAKEADLQKACGMSWSFGSDSRRTFFPYVCSGDFERMTVKYRVRLYFKDSDGKTRYVTMMTDSALQDFRLEPSSLYFTVPDYVTTSNVARYLNAQNADQLIEALTYGESYDSGTKYLFDMKSNVQIGVKGDKEDAYLGLSSQVKSWNPNTKTWSVQ